MACLGARETIGLSRPPAPRPPPGTTAGPLLLSPVPLDLLVQVIVIAVEDYLAGRSAGKLGRTPFLHDGNVPLAAVKGAYIWIGGLTSGFPLQGSLGRGGPWGSVWRDNVHETGVSRGGHSGSRIAAAEAQQVSELEERPDPIRGFCALQASRRNTTISRPFQTAQPRQPRPGRSRSASTKPSSDRRQLRRPSL